MIIKNRKDFETYILQSLGEPVIKVNLAKEQVQNAIDDAVITFQQYHHEGAIRCYLKQIITPSILRVKENFDPKDFDGGKIEGLESKTSADLVSYHPEGRNISKDKILYIQQIKGNGFKAGEKICLNGDNKKTLTLLSDPKKFFEIGIIDDHRIKVPDWIIGVTDIIQYGQDSSSENLFDLQYQIRLNDFLAYDTFHTGDLAYFEQAMEHIDLLNFELNPKIYFQFSQYEGYLYPTVRWGFDFEVGQYMIIECIRALDPSKASMIWNDPWLKKYAVALAKKQWGTNLSKFNNIQLPGGISYSGAEILSQANQEIDKLDEQLLNFFPVSTFRMA